VRRARSPWICLLAAGCGASGLGVGPALLGPPEEPAPPGFAERVAPVLAAHCLDCHSAAEAEGGLVLEGAGPADVLAEPGLWRAVRERVALGEMPPADAASRPAPAEVAAVVSWLDAALGPPPAPPPVRAGDPGRVTLRRLTRGEYDRTVRDLLGVHLRPSADFPADEVGYGFDRIGDVQSVPPLLMEKYLAAAEAVADEAIQIAAPVARTVEAEDAIREGRGGTRGGFAWLVTVGAFSFDVEVPVAGDYLLRARVAGDQAGSDPVRLAFRVDGRDRARRDVEATVDAPGVYEARVRLAEGKRRIGVAFLNDYYRPQHEDPAERDRNMAVDWLSIAGPDPVPPPPESHRRLIPREPAGADDVRPAAREALATFLRRAWRRPVTEAEVERHVDLVALAVSEGDPFARGIQLAVTAALVSPHFLFKVELDPEPDDPGAVHPVSEVELATRLSYFLWSSCPDAELLDLAEAGRLRAELEAQTTRLLDDPRATALTEEFAGQWLQLRRLEEASPDPGTYPTFDEELRRAMRVETEMVFEAVMREDRSVLDLVGGRFTFVNERLARHYGIEGVRGPRYRRVALPPERAGVLTHASVLTVTSNPTRTSPVRRGKWILETLLDDPPPPPPGVDDLPERHPDGSDAPLTLRERLDLHRRAPACAVCHDRLDPLGFGLERFDGVGALRTEEAGRPIDAAGELPGGARFEGARGLSEYLLGREREVALALARKLLVFALGRGLRPADEAPLAALVDRLAPAYRFHDLVHGLVALDAFQRRRGEAPGGAPR